MASWVMIFLGYPSNPTVPHRWASIWVFCRASLISPRQTRKKNMKRTRLHMKFDNPASARASSIPSDPSSSVGRFGWQRRQGRYLPGFDPSSLFPSHKRRVGWLGGWMVLVEGAYNQCALGCLCAKVKTWLDLVFERLALLNLFFLSALAVVPRLPGCSVVPFRYYWQLVNRIASPSIVHLVCGRVICVCFFLWEVVSLLVRRSD